MRQPILALLLAASAVLLTGGGSWSAELSPRIYFFDPSLCTVPPHLNLVGFGLQGADEALGEVQVIVRDLARNPIPNVEVLWDFSGCPGLRIAADQPAPGLAMNCGTHRVSCLTDAAGVARFTIVGGGLGDTGLGPQSSSVYVNIGGWDGQFLLGRVPVAAYDLTGVDGVGVLDLRTWAGDYFGATDPGRSDYDGDGRVSGLDLVLWCRAFFEGGSVFSGTSYCP